MPVKDIEYLGDQTRLIQNEAKKLFRELSETKEEKRDVYLHLKGIGLAAKGLDTSLTEWWDLSANLGQIEKMHPHHQNVKALRLISIL